MMLLRRLALAFFVSACACLAQEVEEFVEESTRTSRWDFLTQIEESGLEMNTNPGTSWNIEPGELDTVVTLDGGADIKHAGVHLFADSVKVSTATQDLNLSGNVRIYRDELVFKGDSAIYNYGDGRVTANNLRSGQDPVLFSAGSFRSKFNLEAKTADFFEADSTLVTTHDLEKPNYRIQAGRVKILPPARQPHRDA